MRHLLPILALSFGAAALADDATHSCEVVPFFSKPFEGEFPTTGVYDHDPFETGEHRQLTSWDTVTYGKNGHDGWDWGMKRGTELFAVADGVVFEAGTKKVTCGDGKGPRDATFARIRHDAPNGEIYIVGYLHLSEVLIEDGQKIARGQLIGRSGNSGCTSGPHLHFAVEHVTDREKMKGEKIDPYGWESDRPDPRFVAKDMRSVWLWKEGEAPLVYKAIGANKDAKGKGVVITRMSGFSWRDDRYPNGEWIEVALAEGNPKDKLTLSGVQIRNNAGDTYTFPKGFTLRAGEPVRVFSGEGTDTDRALFWGRSAGAWDDAADCAHLVSPKGEVVSTHHWGRIKEDLCRDELRQW